MKKELLIIIAVSALIVVGCFIYAVIESKKEPSTDNTNVKENIDNKTTYIEDDDGVIMPSYSSNEIE